MIITILHTTTGVVGLNFQPVVDQGQNFQLAVTQVYNFQLDFQPAKKGKLKTRLKNMLWLNFRPFIRSCEFCTTCSVRSFIQVIEIVGSFFLLKCGSSSEMMM